MWHLSFYGQPVTISQQISLGIFNSACGNEIGISFRALSFKTTKKNRTGRKNLKVSKDLFDKTVCSVTIANAGKYENSIFFPRQRLFSCAHKTVLRTVKKRFAQWGRSAFLAYCVCPQQ